MNHSTYNNNNNKGWLKQMEFCVCGGDGCLVFKRMELLYQKCEMSCLQGEDVVGAKYDYTFY